MQHVYVNRGDSPIFITVKYRPDPYGGPAITEQAILIRPGDGIDIEAVTPLRKMPESKTCIITGCIIKE